MTRIRRQSASPLTAAEIERYSIPVPESGCWLWTRGTDKAGYGKTWVAGRHLGAHRAAYAAFVGEIPPGMEVLHSCDTPLCCNPSHLRVGTHWENSQDRKRRDRGYRMPGVSNPSALLSEQTVRAIRAFPGSASAAAREFRVSIATAWRIRTNQSWQGVK